MGFPKGKKLSKEHKRRIAKSMEGGNSGSFQKGHKINLGRKHSEKIIKKISKTQTKRWKNPKIRKKRIKAIFRAINLKPNKSEQKLNQLLQANFPNEFKFVGDGSVIIEGFNPDFINCNGKKLIIELFGNFWHNLPSYIKRDNKKLNIYSGYGYKTLIIWQKELRKPKIVIEKIRGFLYAKNQT